MKNTKNLLRGLIIAAAMPLAIAAPAIAGPEHNHDTMTADAPTMDAKAKKVWDRSIEATMNGKTDQEWIDSVRMTGTMSMPSQGISAEMNILIVPDSGMTLAITIPGMGAFASGVNGDVVWSSNMMEGPKILEGAEAKQMSEQMDVMADLHWEKYFSSVTYKGEEEIELPNDTTVNTHVLELTSITDGEVSTRYFDADSGLTVMSVTMAAIPGGGKIPATTYMLDYREVEGMMMSFKNISSTGPMQQVIEFDKVEINGDVKPGELDLPADVKELIED